MNHTEHWFAPHPTTLTTLNTQKHQPPRTRHPSLGSEPEPKPETLHLDHNHRANPPTHHPTNETNFRHRALGDDATPRLRGMKVMSRPPRIGVEKKVCIVLSVLKGEITIPSASRSTAFMRLCSRARQMGLRFARAEAGNAFSQLMPGVIACSISVAVATPGRWGRPNKSNPSFTARTRDPWEVGQADLSTASYDIVVKAGGGRSWSSPVGVPPQLNRDVPRCFPQPREVSPERAERLNRPQSRERDRRASVSTRVENRYSNAVNVVLELAVILGPAPFSDLAQGAPVVICRGDGLRGEALEGRRFQHTIANWFLGERQHRFGDARGVNLHNCPDAGVHPHGSAALDLVNVDDLVVVEFGEVDGVAELSGESAQPRLSDPTDLNALQSGDGNTGQAEAERPRTVAAPTHEVAGLHGLQQPQNGGPVHIEGLGQFTEAFRAG